MKDILFYNMRKYISKNTHKNTNEAFLTTFKKIFVIKKNKKRK